MATIVLIVTNLRQTILSNDIQYFRGVCWAEYGAKGA